LGRAKHELGELEEALVCFDRAIALDAKYYQAWYGKGMILREMGNNKLSMKCFEKVLFLNPSYEEVWITVPVRVEATPPAKIKKNIPIMEKPIPIMEKPITIMDDSLTLGEKLKQISLEISTKELDYSEYSI